MEAAQNALISEAYNKTSKEGSNFNLLKEQGRNLHEFSKGVLNCGEIVKMIEIIFLNCAKSKSSLSCCGKRIILTILRESLTRSD
jgi:hypothetical protein